VPANILVVDDDQGMTRFLSLMLDREGYGTRCAHSATDAIALLKKESFDVVITDLKMPDGDGISVLEGARDVDPSIPVVIMTAHPSQRSAIDALNKGAFQYIEKKAKNEEIRLVVSNAIQMRRIQSQNIVLRKQLRQTSLSRQILGKSDEIDRVLRLVDKVADTDATVLIDGESGTGKELIARKIHEQSGRSSGPFLAINCGALPKDLLESTLFGHIKGAFTGAIKDQVGHFQGAENGTLFLDEIGDTALATQVKLLRAIQEREVIPVGGAKSVKVNVRLIAATNRDLEAEVGFKNFRKDLYYRLNVIAIKLPPLRDRKDDIPLLVEHFLKKLSPTEARTFNRESMDVLAQYNWPGNVRELENVVERAIILGDSTEISVIDLPERLLRGDDREGSLVIDSPTMTLEELEKAYIFKVLEHTGWQKKRASEILGINASTLYRKLQTYSLDGFAEDGEPEDRRRAA
jgi:DNA-binding NtrC family response regulator